MQKGGYELWKSDACKREATRGILYNDSLESDARYAQCWMVLWKNYHGVI